MLGGEVRVVNMYGCIGTRSLGIFEYVDDGVSPEEHLGNEPTLVDGRAFLPLARHLGPNLLNVLHHHVHVPVEGLHLPQQFLVVAQSDQDLVVGLH